MDLNKRKRSRESKTLNEKYEIITFYENLVKENKKNCKTTTIQHFKLKQISSLNAILNKIDEIKETYLENQSSEKRIRLTKGV